MQNNLSFQEILGRLMTANAEDNLGPPKEFTSDHGPRVLAQTTLEELLLLAQKSFYSKVTKPRTCGRQRAYVASCQNKSSHEQAKTKAKEAIEPVYLLKVLSVEALVSLRILELHNTTTITLSQIKSSFRRKAKETHPDATKNDPVLSEKFQQARNAYQILIRELSGLQPEKA